MYYIVHANNFWHVAQYDQPNKSQNQVLTRYNYNNIYNPYGILIYPCEHYLRWSLKVKWSDRL